MQLVVDTVLTMDKLVALAQTEGAKDHIIQADLLE
jgi:hypothetical protein